MSMKRQKLKNEFWPNETDIWSGEEVGWFKIPRTFPLLCALLKKDIRGKEDPTAVYLELLSHHYGDGFVVLNHESEHAFASGFTAGRVRSWRERIEVLEDLGFIKTKGTGAQKYKYVLLVHPTVVIQKLRDEGKVHEDWWNTYQARKTYTGELKFDQLELQKQEAAAKVAEVAPGSKTSPKVKSPVTQPKKSKSK